MKKKVDPKELVSLESIAEFCKDYRGIGLSKDLKKYFLKVVFDYYDEDGPGSYEDIKSEIYVFDKALFAFDFFQKLGFFIYDIFSTDLYRPHKYRSQGYKKAYSHTAKMISKYGGSNGL